MTSFYHCQSTGQLEAYIKYVKCTTKKCRQTNNDVNFALLQIRSTLEGPGILSPATLLFNRLIRALLPQIGRKPINITKDIEYYEALKSGQQTYIRNNDTHNVSIFFSAGLQKLFRGMMGVCRHME